MAIHQTFEHMSRVINSDTTLLGTLALGVFSSLYLRERAATLQESRQYEGRPRVVSRPNARTEDVFVVRVGFRQNIDNVANLIDEYLEPHGSRYYMKSSPDDEANKEARLEIARQADGQPMTVFGISKGGKDEMFERSDPVYAAEHGAIDRFVLESSPLHPSHVRGKGRALLHVVRLLPPNRFVAHYYNRHHSRDAVTTNFYEARAEIPALLGRLPSDGSVAEGMSPDKVGKLQYYTSRYDDVVDTFAAYTHLLELTGREDAELIVACEREHGNHAGITDNPARHIEDIEHHIAERYGRSCNRASTSSSLT